MTQPVCSPYSHPMASLFQDTDSPVPDGIGADLDVLERRLLVLIGQTHALRAANEGLRRDLSSTQSHNRMLNERVLEARARIEALAARLPEVTQ